MARYFLPSLWLQRVGLSASLFLFACGEVELEPDPENTAAKCADGVDNDLDGSPDCFDLDCIAFPNCDVTPDPEVCSGGVDEDEDGFVDCEDPDCTNDPACDQSAENCNNDIDDDGDGLTDCDDAGCAQNPQCTANPGGGEGGGPASTCFDAQDNDNDGDANCDDDECTDECNGANTPEICNNNIDDNFDGRIDCADPQCANQPNCAVNGSEICFDGIDNDGVNGVDCSDVDCFADPFCGGGGGGGGGFFEICGNGIDDDAQFSPGADCDDFACAIDPTATDVNGVPCLPGPGTCNPNGASVFECGLGLNGCTCADDINCIFFDPCCLDPNAAGCPG